MTARRSFLVICAVALPMRPLCALAQVAEKTYRIGYLAPGYESEERKGSFGLGVLVRNLRALGYVEGRNLIVEARFAEGSPQKLAPLAAELVRSRADVIVVPSAGLAETILEHKLLQDVVPGLRRVAVLRGVPFEGPGYELYRGATDRAAQQLGIRVRYVQFQTPEDLDRLFEEMARERDQGLLVWGNPHLIQHSDKIADLCIRYRMPSVSDIGQVSRSLLSYTVDIQDVLREGASYVDRILKGAKAGELPIGQAKTFRLIVNVGTAKAIGLTIPQPLLLRADEVIQ